MATTQAGPVEPTTHGGAPAKDTESGGGMRPGMLMMLFFLGSEAMLFASLFAAYFFVFFQNDFKMHGITYLILYLKTML